MDRGSPGHPRPLAVRLMLGVVLLLGALASVRAEEVRTWSDASGKFRVQAQLLRVEQTKVVLQGDDGGQFEVEYARLSKADQQYVDAHTPDPFQPLDEASTKDAKSEKSEKSDSRLPERQRGPVRVKYSGVRKILPVPQPEWKFPVSATLPKIAEIPEILKIPAKRSWHEQSTALLANAACHRVLLGYYWNDAASNKTTRLILCDINGGPCVEGFGAGAMLPLALSDRGNEVVMRSNTWGFGGNARLELWTLTAAGAEVTTRWLPYEEGNGSAANVSWAEYLDAEHLVTLSETGVLALWQLNPLKPLCSLQIDPSCTPALSPDRRWLVCSAGEQVGVVDLRQAKVLAVRALPVPEHPVFAFSPSGARLACRTGQRVYLWDFATGELRRRLTLEGRNSGKIFFWTNEEFLLVDNLLLGADSQIRLWRYEDLEGAALCGGLSLLLPREQGSGPFPQPLSPRPVEREREANSLLALTLPQAGVRERLNRAMEDPEFVVLQPGTTVRLNVEGVADPAMRLNVGQILTTRLQARGYAVDPSGKVELQASTEKGRVVHIGSRLHIGPGFSPAPMPSSVNYDFQQYTCSLKLVCQNETLWTESCINGPGIIEVEGGKSVEAWLREHEKPNYDWFGTVELPRTAVKGIAQGAFGCSHVTPTGLQ